MRSFICKVQGGKIVPLVPSQERTFKKILNDAETYNRTLIFSIEEVEKTLTPKQIKMYQAYIVKASEHFGSTFIEMEKELFRFFPVDVEAKTKKSVEKWTTAELEQFIISCNKKLGEFGFQFK